jgi:hypothetical protein
MEDVIRLEDRARFDAVDASITPYNHTHSSGVSWAAVIAGAFVSAALSLSLLALGAGFGLSSVSPWSNVGASAATVGSVAIAWLVLMQVVSSSMGGYLAGRLRSRWAAIHTDEVYFRDTAHGFLVWAVAFVITASLLATSALSLANGAAQREGVASATADSQSSSLTPGAYFIDQLFRSDHPGIGTNDAPTQAEAGRIFTNALREQDIPSSDKTYLAQMVAAKTGLSQPAAEQRVSAVLADARQAEDTARKAVAHVLLWIFLALLTGAFCASLAATIGGRQRDHVKIV